MGIFFPATLEFAFCALTVGSAKDINQDFPLEYYFSQDYDIYSVLRSAYGCIN